MNLISAISVLSTIIFASMFSCSTSAPSLPVNSESNQDRCSATELVATPCRCCKMDCWYTVAKSATHELGHVPGQAGEDEALATLRLIRTCMITECSAVCASTMSARPFRPVPKFELSQ
uniref:Secreted protein n=1 Tax=Acrobeloides nanus TaxID=290746 RepID=A0A914C2T1_9BILA